MAVASFWVCIVVVGASLGALAGLSESPIIPSLAAAVAAVLGVAISRPQNSGLQSPWHLRATRTVPGSVPLAITTALVSMWAGVYIGTEIRQSDGVVVDYWCPSELEANVAICTDYWIASNLVAMKARSDDSIRAFQRTFVATYEKAKTSQEARREARSDIAGAVDELRRFLSDKGEAFTLKHGDE